MNDPLGLISGGQGGVRGVGPGVSRADRGGAASGGEAAERFRAALREEFVQAERMQRSAAESAERVSVSDDQLASLSEATRQADDAISTLMRLSERMRSAHGIGLGGGGGGSEGDRAPR
ncbi:MAG: hypothetical protein ACTS3F_06970 [Phycisphaerales bacterium]